MDALLLYFGAGTLLFFFWVYGIASFALDLKNKFIPGAKQFLRGRRAQKEQREQEQERREREEQLL
ncbi:hypothetical protein [Haloarchaeobius sp. DFWS5]|uniref:hypothetical protein n=1 Tax=Haloarchaeobius sp. DFWS5 TaxID=3446114 RepID=UPI003EBB7B0C